MIRTRPLNFHLTQPLRTSVPHTITPATITTVIQHDQHLLSSYHAKLLAIPQTDSDTRARYQNQFSWLLAKHVVGSELVVYPAYEQFLGTAGREAVLVDRGKNAAVKDALEYFQRVYPHSVEFLPKLEEVMRLQSGERKVDLRELEKKMGETESARLAREFRRMERFVPSRAHPWAGTDHPGVFETVAVMLATPVDVLGDLFRRFPEKEELREVEDEVWFEEQDPKGKEGG